MADGEPRGGRPASGRARVLLVVLSAGASLIFAECALRVAWQNPYRHEGPERVLRLPLHHPNRALPVDRRAIDPETPVVPLRTDARSYIRPARRFDDPHATIAFLGGSTTECAAVREALRFPALVSTLLEERGLRVNTLNAGRSGNASHDSLNVLLNHVVYDAPDAVVLMNASNDVGILRHYGSYQPLSGAPPSLRLPLVWLGQAASKRSSLAGALRRFLTTRALRPRETVPAPPDARDQVPADAFAKRLRAFAATCRAFGFTPVLMTQPHVAVRTPLTPDWTDAKAQERFNAVVRRVAAEQDVLLIDLARDIFELVEDWNEPMRVFYDGVHVTDLGSQVYGEHIAARLLESLPVLRERSAAARGAPPDAGRATPAGARSR